MTSNLKYCVIRIFALIKKRVWMRTKSDQKDGEAGKEEERKKCGANRGQQQGRDARKETNKQTRKERQKEIRKRNGGVGGINAESRSLDFLPEAPPPIQGLTPVGGNSGSKGQNQGFVV